MLYPRGHRGGLHRLEKYLDLDIHVVEKIAEIELNPIHLF